MLDAWLAIKRSCKDKQVDALSVSCSACDIFDKSKLFGESSGESRVLQGLAVHVGLFKNETQIDNY